MAGPAGPMKLHPAAPFTPLPGGVQSIPLTLGGDIDLTLPSGPTGGLCARGLLIGATGGNVGYYDTSGAGPFVQVVNAYQFFGCNVAYIVNATTTAATVSAVL